MFDQTVNVEHGRHKYWVRVRDGVVANVQGYNNQYSNVEADRWGVSVTHSSHAANRVFVDTPDGQVFFDVGNSHFAAAPGNVIRLSYVGPLNKNGYLRYAVNQSNRSWVEFDHWKTFLPSCQWPLVAAFVCLLATCLLIIANGQAKTPQQFGATLQQQWPILLVAAGCFALSVQRFLLRSAIMAKIHKVLNGSR